MFSELVDEVLQSLGRAGPLPKTEAAKYANMTIRECSDLEYFFADSVEDEWILASESETWPYNGQFRFMRTVRVIDIHGNENFPPFIQPGRKQKDHDAFYYFGPNYMALKGYGANTVVNLFYYQWPRHLVYYEDGSRPAVYDWTTQTWSYLDSEGNYVATLGTTEEDEAARDKVTNWLLEKWNPVVFQGTATKMLNIRGEEAKQRSMYNLYTNKQDEIRTQEPYDSMNV